MMEEKILRKVLTQISNQESPTAAPDEQYLKALEEIGMIKKGWEYELTQMGIDIMKYLDNKINPW